MLIVSDRAFCRASNAASKEGTHLATGLTNVCDRMTRQYKLQSEVNERARRGSTHGLKGLLACLM